MTNTFINEGKLLTAADATVYTCTGAGPPAKQSIVHSCTVSNIHTSDSADVDIKVTTDGGSTYFYVAKNVPVPQGSTLVLDKPIDMANGDILQMKSTATNTLNTVLGILEIT